MQILPAFGTNNIQPCETVFYHGLATLQVTQPLGYVGTLPVIRINESTAEWTARDCYVSLLAASPPFSSIKLLRNCPIFLNNVNKNKILILYIFFFFF
jgi:hypothetical protein